MWLNSLSPQKPNDGRGAIIIPILQVRKLKLGEVVTLQSGTESGPGGYDSTATSPHLHGVSWRAARRLGSVCAVISGALLAEDDSREAGVSPRPSVPGFQSLLRALPFSKLAGL